MRILLALKSGFIRSLNSWKAALILLLVFLLFALVAVSPLKAAMKAGFGSSMITERMQHGFNIEVFTDMSSVFRSLISYFSSSILMLFLVSFIVNAFLSGGLFHYVSSEKQGATGFWGACSKNFWSFLIITVMVDLMIVLMLLLVFGLPMSIASSGAGETTVINTMIISGSISIILLPIFILVADYARAWQYKNEERRSFAAIGFGFGRTFSTFISSWFLMFLIIIIQALYWLFVIKVIPGMNPSTGGGVFLLFLLTQVLLFGKIILKIMRYGSVTSLMDQTSSESAPVAAMSAETAYDQNF